MSTRPPLLLVVMGVSGCGKSTFASAISTALNLSMIDGDDLHTPESVAKMHAGIALDDADRWPWLERIAGTLALDNSDGTLGKVVACSALKRAYRDRIRSALPTVVFVFLDGDSELIRHRMASRTGHFMQLDLLGSQLRTLERPAADEGDVLTVDIDQPVGAMVASLVRALHVPLPL